MDWMLLIVAGLFEMGWAVGLKYTAGFTKPVPTMLTAAALVVSMALLAISLRSIPLGTGYAVWTGIGVLGTATLGILLFHEPVTGWRVLCLGMILAGIIGLKLSAKGTEEQPQGSETMESQQA